MTMSSPLAALDLVHHAIAAGIFGQIQWDERADERARSNPDLQGLTPEGIRRLLHDFVCGGGRLDERQEARPIGSKRMPIGRPIIGILGIGPWYRFRACSRTACLSRSAFSMTTRKTPGSRS